MNIKKTVTRVAAPLAVSGLAAAAVVGLGATSASASTIQNGYLQLCAQGNYSAFVHVLPVDLGGGLTTRSYESFVVPAGQCWWAPVDTAGQWAQVDVVGIYNDSGQEFYIGSEWYNGNVSGMGIGAEGASTSPWIQTW